MKNMKKQAMLFMTTAFLAGGTSNVWAKAPQPDSAADIKMKNDKVSFISYRVIVEK